MSLHLLAAFVLGLIAAPILWALLKPVRAFLGRTVGMRIQYALLAMTLRMSGKTKENLGPLYAFNFFCTRNVWRAWYRTMADCWKYRSASPAA